MANTVTVSGLTDYINQRRDELFVKSVAGAKSLDYVEIMTNVKYKEALHYLDSTVVLADGSECSWNPQGSDVFTEKFIEVKPIKVEKSYCWKDFRKKWLNYELQFEAGRETLPAQEKIAESNVNAVQLAVEDLVWKGDSGLSINGWIDIIKAESGASVEFASGATVTAKIDQVVAALPLAALKKGVNIFMSYTDFRGYVAEANATCCANRGIIDAASETLTYLGDSRITLIPVLGLEGTNAIVAASKEALVYATDLEDSESVLKWFYVEKDDTFNFRILFNAGMAVKYIDEVVLGEPAA